MQGARSKSKYHKRRKDSSRGYATLQDIKIRICDMHGLKTHLLYDCSTGNGSKGKGMEMVGKPLVYSRN